ncbi:preprotein translocase subunit YajC [Nocardioides sp. CN2-186]|uniref:preprotein translocase subunit YajC n=1 Tax=Nocardioides tweenelious TaxID=3156607 RepID=UPI0032B43D76
MLELLPLVGIALLFWLFIIRPASRRQKELRSMQSSLSVGDEIVLTSGVFGTVREMDDETVRVEIADGVTIKVARGAVGTIDTRAEQPTDAADSADTHEHQGPVTDGPQEN